MIRVMSKMVKNQDGQNTETKEFVFTQEEVTQHEMKNVIKLTVSVRADDQTSVIRAQYILPQGQKNTPGSFEDILWVSYPHTDGTITLDSFNVIETDVSNVGSWHSSVPTFAREASYIATGYLFLQTDYENVANAWLKVLQDKSESKFKKLITVLMSQIEEQRAHVKKQESGVRLEDMKGETLRFLGDDDDKEFRQETERMVAQHAGLDQYDGVSFDDGYMSE